LIVPKNIVLISEYMQKPFDEGMRKTAWEILNALVETSQVQGICRFGQASNEPPLKVIPCNRMLVSLKLFQAVTSVAPDILLYIPSACGTFASFLRMKILEQYARKSCSVMLILQPKQKSRLQKKLLTWLKPKLVLSPSPEAVAEARNHGMRAEFFPLGVWSEKFRPVKNEQTKRHLREKYGLPLDKFIILHVGHINPGRNLEGLIPLNRKQDQLVLVGSTSTPKGTPPDVELKAKLKTHGILVLDSYYEDIQELYQSADLYVFPVTNPKGCIAIPLSVMEARACGIPVVSTDYGGLREVFPGDGDGVLFAGVENFVESVKIIKQQLGQLSSGHYDSRALFLRSLHDRLGLVE
jgi:glycosyltransferase involved in cell wall biosynthesis